MSLPDYWLIFETFEFEDYVKDQQVENKVRAERESVKQGWYSFGSTTAGVFPKGFLNFGGSATRRGLACDI